MIFDSEQCTGNISLIASEERSTEYRTGAYPEHMSHIKYNSAMSVHFYTDMDICFYSISCKSQSKS